MATYSLRVNIATNQLPLLKQSGFNLCIAKEVNGIYTVVWSGSKDYLIHQTFEWTEEYQVFGSNTFKVGALTSASTNAEGIKFGQNSLLDKDGIMHRATGPSDKSGKFEVKNEFGLIAIGVNAKIAGEFKPIFVSPTVIAGQGQFRPVNNVKVWFSIAQKTNTMIFDWDTEGIEVSFTDATDQAIEYAGKEGFGTWSIL